ncbi:MAG: hypothetical protein KAR84_06865 [Elusimicrobiales bacterium]|nr:hypothetical protein [Elusimicrobiales bacterium]
MAHAYTPGLKAIPCTRLTKNRLLPIPGKVLVEKDKQVGALDVVAETALPGRVYPMNIANRLGINPDEVKGFMIKQPGDKIKKGEVIAETKPFIKWFKTTIESPVTGTVDSLSEITGQVLLRATPKILALKAYVKGKVIDVQPDFGVTVESEGTFIQGIFGIGGETNGEIAVAVDSPDQELLPENIKTEHKGKILIGGQHAGIASIKKAIEVGVNAIIVGGIHDKDLRKILGYDIGVAVTGTEKIGLTLVVTEGFGMIPMAEYTYKLLISRKGEYASVSGATQIRAGVMRPEIIIPGFPKDINECKKEEGRGWIEPGDPIRIIREPHFGVIGTVHSLPSELTKVHSESMVRVLTVELSGGEKIVVPRANVEILEK